MSINLLGGTSRIEAPFISVKIGNYNFGVFNKENGNGVYIANQKFMYPNYVHSLDVVKVNGAVNTYTLTLKYQIRPGDDPNFLEKVFSTRAKDRTMILSYGDYSSPSFIYKEEKCTITNVRSSVDINNSAIQYTVTAISDALALNAGIHDFPRYVKAKPSDIIKNELLAKKIYGLQDIFYGMRDPDLITTKGLIASDDKEISIEAKYGITTFNYLKYLVSCMSPASSSSNVLKGSNYNFTIHDDYSGELGGPYFQIKRVDANTSMQNSSDMYEVDIGYPGVDAVMGFSIDDDQTYSILYDYSQNFSQSDFVYKINDDGITEKVYSPAISSNSLQHKTSEADKNWWTQVTQYPIKATLTLKGLLKASTLMSYIKINTYFYGQKHISSGLYIITKQQDQINESGYRTTLSLTRIGGDDQL